MKSPHAFRSIGEVARLVGVATHVLRYWETQFPALAPVRRPDGRRYYRPEDLLLAAGLCEVMREDGLTIRGARLLIDKDRGASLRERGRQRLEAALPLPPGGEERRRRNGSGASAAGSRRKAGDPRMDTPAHAGANPVPAMDGRAVDERHLPASAATWLARLTATTAALRDQEAPLPPEAQVLADKLRRVWSEQG